MLQINAGLASNATNTRGSAIKTCRSETPLPQTFNLADTLRAGSNALRKGDFSAAAECFAQAVAANPGDVSSWLGLGQAKAGLSDDAGAIAAFDKVLEVQPGNLRALLWKGDRLASQGKGRAAAGHYRAALRTAASRPDGARDLAPDLARAQAVCDRLAAQYEDYLRASLKQAGYAAGRAPSRFDEAFDIMVGRKRAYLSQPQVFYYPGLASIAFFPREQFQWLDAVEEATADIRAELLEVLRDDGAFTPYVEADPNRPRTNDAGMTNNPNWGAFYLKKNGRDIPDNIARCPKTCAALSGVPMPDVSQRCPSALFSLLRPRTRIPPHTGLINTRLICHLPLIIPEGCGFRVGNDTRAWVEGKAWVFDDTINHEAWNESGKLRVILLFETWRPELSREERDLVTAMFRAIDAFTGETPSWEI